MSKIRLHGSSSGYTEIAPVAASGNNTLTLPNDGTIISKDSNGAVGVTSVVTTTATITTAKVGAAVTISESGIEASGIGITCANINGGSIGGRRNLIINGAMNVAQRGTSSTSLGASAGYFTLDRYRTTFSSTAGRLTMAQVADVHDGFANAMKFTCTTADTSVGASEYFILQQKFEGQDLQQLQKGSSDAKEFTVSFYVKGNASATYVVEMYDLDNDRQISKTFSVTTSWTRVVLTFPADTTGALDDDNAASLQLGIWLHAGSNYTSGTLNSSAFASNTNANRAVGTSSFFDSTNRTFFLTGLQLELGSQVTPFEHRSFGEELALCQRYYQGANTVGAGYGSADGYARAGCVYATQMRATPTLTATNTGSGSIIAADSSATGFYVTYGSLGGSSAGIFNYVAAAEL